MKYIIAVVVLWALAIVPTVVLLGDREEFTYLGPVYGICMIGSVIVVRHAQIAAARGTG